MNMKALISRFFYYANCLILWEFHQTKGLLESHFCLTMVWFQLIKSIRSTVLAGRKAEYKARAYLSSKIEESWNGLHRFPLHIAIKTNTNLYPMQIPIWTNILTSWGLFSTLITNILSVTILYMKQDLLSMCYTSKSNWSITIAVNK